MNTKPIPLSRDVQPTEVTPSARRLTASLRDIGYDFTSALADIVDNSIAAGAQQVDVEIVFDGADSYVTVADDGHGMTMARLTEAMRFGSSRRYSSDDLGKFGLGLKTASLSQCRRITVVSRRGLARKRWAALTLDLDHIAATNRWELIPTPVDSRAPAALKWLQEKPGTVVVWERLDRVLPERNPEGGWARRRLEALSRRVAEHLAMVFHRFMEGAVPDRPRLVITVNGEKLRAWNPFAPDEPNTNVLPTRTFEVTVGAASGTVTFSPTVLPPKSKFTSPAAFDRLSGPLKWNRQQGLYIYRSHRLIQSGGWAGIRSIDEHTKLARAAVDFSPELDEVFAVNVAKMRATPPAAIRTVLEGEVGKLCQRAQTAYRHEARAEGRGAKERKNSDALGPSSSLEEVGTAIMMAALTADQLDCLEKIMSALDGERPDISRSLGWR